MRNQVSVRFDPDVLDAIDVARGRINRSVFINDVMWMAFVATDDQAKSVINFEGN
jgi:hypothetical protein